ncbi:MAG: PD-(D/E)XK nuclease family protein [Spirochaetes bacterium]|nr:PD-(D/E)XK nuclease family protein [Spirochaetota bacterium]
MTVILGHWLDGEVHGADMPGAVALGPLSFLGMLETHLGCRHPDKPEIRRTFEYERSIADLGEGHFFSSSFARDSFGAAKALLSARDELMTASPSALDITALAGGRLPVLAAIEKNARVLGLHDGVPDRIRAVLEALRSGNYVNPVAALSFVDARETWETLWRELFDELGNCGTDIVVYHAMAISRTGDLEAACSFMRTGERTQWRGDGTLLFIEANNIAEAADAAAAIAAADGIGSTALIAEADMDVLDDALTRAGLPRSGSSIDAYGHDALAILPLFLFTSWEPVDVRAMKDYLLLTVSPLPNMLCQKLSAVISGTYGAGGTHYHGVINNYLSGLSSGERTHEEEVITAWLKIEHIPADQPMPRQYILDAGERFIRWANAKVMSTDEDLYGMDRAIDQAGELCAAVKLKKQDSFSRLDLERLFADIAQTMKTPLPRVRQAQAATVMAHPGAIITPIETVIWFNAAESTLPAQASRFFNDGERSILSGLGTRYPASHERLTRYASAWRRAVMSAGKRLVLIHSSQHSGEADKPHPIQYELAAAFTNGVRTFDVNDIVYDPAALALKQADHIVPAGVPDIEPARREWSLPGGVVPDRTESYSSLEQLIGCPFAYTLKYGLSLSPESYRIDESDEQVYGNIAHAVIGGYLAENTFAADGDIDGVIASRYRDFIEREVCMLAMRERSAERDRVGRIIVSAAKSFVRMLREGKYRVAGVEHRYKEKTKDGIRLTGSCDILIEREQKRAIVDMKWSGYNYREKTLAEGRALQTAVYSMLEGARVPTAFFIIRDAAFLTVHADAFPGAQTVDYPEPASYEKDVWKKAAAEITRVRQGFERMQTAIGVPEHVKTETPFLNAPCGFCDYRLFCRVDEVFHG